MWPGARESPDVGRRTEEPPGSLRREARDPATRKREDAFHSLYDAHCVALVTATPGP